MSAETILYIVIAGVVAFALAVFMYGFRTKYKGKLRWTFGVLRFLSVFLLLVLLINPSFTSESYTIEKPKLPVLIDNSASIIELGREERVGALREELESNSDLNDKFEVAYYTFGSQFGEGDSLSFSDRNTNIASALASTKELYKNDVAPVLLITDGNQTLGSDYEFSAASYANPIYPLIVGDSLQYTDLKIEQLNTNRYAFLKNQFPVEAILVYDGDEEVQSEFVIRQGSSIVYREAVRFSDRDNSKTLSFTLPADGVGLQRYSAQLVPLSDEKNTSNNVKQFAVEVIDQSTNVLIISEHVHPDLGALRKAITANEQRTVTIMEPRQAVGLLNDYQLIVLFQPDRSFEAVFTEIESLKKNTLILTGLSTDWDYLSIAQGNFIKEDTRQSEDSEALLNTNYGTFGVEDIGFSAFPPLESSFGELQVIVPHEVLLEQSISGFVTESPMLATMDINGKRDAIWDGEGIWKWRAQSYLANENFEAFDNFIAKLVQYLASNKRKSRLEVSGETFYYNNNQISISAQYFDQNYVFDPRASLTITVINTETDAQTVFPMLLKNNFYEVDLNSLPAGEYRYTVSVRDESVARSGNFTILDFNVEQQFLNANVSKLRRLASATQGESAFIEQSDAMILGLLGDDRFQSIQKSEQKVIPLVDWRYLLGVLAALLALEWFIRKYNGLV